MLHHLRHHKPSFESLESRRLLAQTPVALTEHGERCYDEVLYSQTPGVAFFRLTGRGSCGINNAWPKVYRTDATPEGTYELGPIQNADDVSGLLEVDGNVYFSTSNMDAVGSGKFYRSDTTPGGTVEVSPEATAWEYQGDLFYLTQTYDPETDMFNGQLRAVRDGTDELVRELDRIGGVAVPVGDIVLFTVGRERTEQVVASDGSTWPRTHVDWDIWRTDGTTEGTFLWRSDAKLSWRSPPGLAYFHILQDGKYGPVMKTDGSDNGTFPEPRDGIGVYKFGDYTLLEPRERKGERSIKATDGQQTHELIPLTESILHFNPPNYPGYVVDEELYLEVEGHLWQTDGTPAGTRSLMPIGSGVVREDRWGHRFHGQQLHATESYFYFEQQEPAGLFRVNRASGEASQIASGDVTLVTGTTEMLVYQLASEPSVDIMLLDWEPTPQRFSDLGVKLTKPELVLDDGKTLLFEGKSSLQGQGYWLTDGTRLGTYKISDLVWGEVEDVDPMVVGAGASDFFQMADHVLFDVLYDARAGVMAIGLNGPDVLDGDMDGDDAVDFADFLALSAAFNALDDASVDHLAADINQDGNLDMRDFEVLQYNYGKSAKSYDWPG